MSSLPDRLFGLMQRILPKYLLTALIYRLARIRTVAIKDFLIRRFIGIYKVDVQELKHPVPEGYPTFNDFFIRELAPGARPVDGSAQSIVSPVDGTVSAVGRIDRDRIIQAKGLDYTVTDLLATDTADAGQYVDGAFATLYLAPYDYHRVHAPVSGELVALRYVPGDLFSVNAGTMNHVPRLFVRNERVVCHLRTTFGPLAVILVGALNVGTISTRWTGALRPRSGGVVEQFDLRDLGDALSIAKGDTIGWFNMGSTVILLVPPGASDGFAALEAGQTLRMGQSIGRLAAGQ